MTDLPAHLLSASSAIVSDALDALGLRNQVVDARVRPLFPTARVVGRAYPVLVGEDDTVPEHPYAGEMDALSAMTPGDVGVYAVHGNHRAAAWGELFSCGAIGRGARGVLVDGCVRDAQQIEQLSFPVFAVDRSPFDTLARARVIQHGQPVMFGGLPVARGDVMVADADGILVIPAIHVPAVAAFVQTKHRLEQGARDDLMAGLGIREVWEKYGVF